MVEKRHTLYKRGSHGEVRVWWMEIDGDSYRAVSGVLEGKMVESDFKTAKPKNTGRSNATTGPEQAVLEVESKYENQLTKGGYFERIEDIDNATYFEPMLAIKWKDSDTKWPGRDNTAKAFANGTRVFVQPKLDGYRAAVQRNGLFSRSGEDYQTVPHILVAAEPFHRTNPLGVMDGELYNHEYHDNFNVIQKLVAPGRKEPTLEQLEAAKDKVQFHMYDFWSNENPKALFSERLEYMDLLEKTGFFNDFIRRVPTVEVHSLEEIYEQQGIFLEAGYEGIMIRIDGPYENKRSKSLIKFKEFFDEEYTVLDIEEGQGNWAGKAKKAYFKTADGYEFKATPKGTEDEMRQLLIDKDKFIGGEATVRYPNKTPDGAPRFGIVVAFHGGKRKA